MNWYYMYKNKEEAGIQVINKTKKFCSAMNGFKF